MLIAVGLPAAVRAETARRVVIWPDGEVSEETLEGSRRRLVGLGEVIDLPAPAPPGPSEAEQALRAEASTRLDEAQAQYYEARFDEASTLLESFIEDRGEEMGAAGCLDNLRHLLVWLGASLAKLERDDEAQRAFALARRLGQDEIDRALFPPEVTAAFDRAGEVIAAAPRVELALTTRPEQLALEVDGQPLDWPRAAPLRLGAGRHLVVGRRPGFQPAARVVELEAEGATPLALELRPAGQELLVRQVARLRRDGALDPARPGHLELVTRAVDAELAAVVSPGGELRLVDRSGAEVPLPPVLAETIEDEPETPEAPPPEPVWRRWWFWVSVVGGAAVLATGVGLGVYFGTRPDDMMFNLVP